MDEKTRKTILGFQKNEITEYYIYKTLSRLAKSAHNREVLERISGEELRHYNIWKGYSGEEVRPDSFKYWFYVITSFAFGVTFGVKLMESGESGAQVSYAGMADAVPEAGEIQKDENEHENELVAMIDEEKLKYMGSVVLGLNDALVEFTGALAGFTLALRNSRLIGTVGLIMGFAASLSMAASEYLSTKTEDTQRDPVKASIYTGVAYVMAVLALIFPYFVFSNYYLALALTVTAAILLILVFTFYFSVVRGIPFKGRFTEMLAISMGVSAASFLIGVAVRKVLNIDI